MRAPVLWILGGACGSLAFLAGCSAILGIKDFSAADGDAGSSESSSTSGSIGSASSGSISGLSSSSDYTVDCFNYCNIMATACLATLSGDNTEYLVSRNASVCLAMCQSLPISAEAISASLEPTPDNTLNCRVWYANAAHLGDPHTHCPHAGPLGGNVCDDNLDPCEVFCAMEAAICTGTNFPYETPDDCLSACRPNPDAGYTGFPYVVDVGDLEVTDLAPQFQAGSNTLNCRLYSLENFLLTGDPVYCTYTSKSGNDVCAEIDGG